MRLTTTDGPIDFYWETVVPATTPNRGSVAFRIDAGNVGTWQNIDGTAAGWVRLLPAGGAVTFLQTASSTWTLMDNDADAWDIGAAGAATMLVFDTRNTVETVAIQTARLTVRDNVPAGTNRVVGGRAFASIVDSTAIAQANADGAFDQTYNIPASTLKEGSLLHIRAVTRISTVLSGGATERVRLLLGGVVILTAPQSTAGAAGTRCVLDAWLTFRGVPGPGVGASGVSQAVWSDTVAAITAQPGAAAAVPNFATNGALLVSVDVNASAGGTGFTVLEQLLVEIV